MQKFIYILLFFGIIGIGIYLLDDNSSNIVVIEGNYDQLPLDIELNRTQDAHCGMILDSLDFAGQIVSEDGKTWFFHDIGGVALWLKDKKLNNIRIYAYTIDTKSWIDATVAYYSRVEKSPMGYGFGAYEKMKDGFIGFDEMYELMLKGENLINPKVKKALLGEN